MRIKFLTLAAVIGLTQLASGGPNFAGFTGTFTTDSLYHRKSEQAQAPLVAGVGDSGRIRAKTTTATSRDRRSRLQRLLAGR